MTDRADQLLEALDLLGEVAEALPPEQAVDELDAATLQTFWREWPRASAWAGTVWRLLNAELEAPSETVGDPDLDELGGGD